MALDVLANYFEATTSAGGTTNSTGDTTITVAAISGTAPALTSGVTQLRVMDKAQVNVIGGEVMLLTANGSGGAGTWTVQRAVEGSISNHAAGWVMVPVTTAKGVVGSAGGSSVPMVSGDSLVVPQVTAAGQFSPAGQTLYFTSLVIPASSAPITKLGLGTGNNAGGANPILLGLYSDNANTPGTLLQQVSLSPSAFSNAAATLTTPDSGPWPARRWVAFLGTTTTNPNVTAAPYGYCLTPMSGLASRGVNSTSPFFIGYTLTGQTSLPTNPSGFSGVVAQGTANNWPLVWVEF